MQRLTPRLGGRVQSERAWVEENGHRISHTRAIGTMHEVHVSSGVLPVFVAVNELSQQVSLHVARTRDDYRQALQSARFEEIFLVPTDVLILNGVAKP